MSHQTLRRLTHQLKQRVEQRFNIRIVRADVVAPAPHTHAPDPPFAPLGDDVRNGWHTPDELRHLAPHLPWCHTLAQLYDRPFAWPGSVSPETGWMLHTIVRNIRPTTIVETGNCHGASSIWMGAAMRDNATLHSFDAFIPPDNDTWANAPLYQNQEQQVRQRFRDAGLDNRITLHVGDSSANIAALRPQLERLELAYIDADHSYAGITKDVQAVEPLIPIGGFLALHDVFPEACGWSGPRVFLDNIHDLCAGRYEQCSLHTAPNNYGVTLLRRTG